MSPPPRRAGRARLPPGTTALLRRALKEDRWTNDVTTRAVLPRSLPGRAQVIAQRRGVLSGLTAAQELARIGGLRSSSRLTEGSEVRPGTVVLELSGDLRRILAVERTLLNLLMHLSGVATETANIVRTARRSRSGFRIRATRKTLPGLRDLEKAAVVHGGGEPHRRDLSSAGFDQEHPSRAGPVGRRRSPRTGPPPFPRPPPGRGPFTGAGPLGRRRRRPAPLDR